MPTYHFDITQGTPEWHVIRSGQWSASNAAKIMGGLETQGLDDLIRTIAWERVYGPSDEPAYKSAAMQRGNDLEAEARDWLAFQSDTVVEQCGFVQHGTVARVGWSPDGLSHKRKRGQEIKCLLHKAYMDVLKKREVPAEYRWQVRWAHWAGELDGLDFVAYHPQAGGIIVPCEPEPSLYPQMEERVALLEKRVAVWVDMLNDRKAA